MENRYFTNMFYLKNKLLANDEKKKKIKKNWETKIEQKK